MSDSRTVDIVEAPRSATERSPADLLRLVVATAVTLGLVLLDWFFGDTLIAFVHDLLRGLDAIPTWILTVVVVATRIGTVLALAVGLALAFARGRMRLLLTVVFAGVAGAALFALAAAVATKTLGSVAHVSDTLGLVTAKEFPTAAGLAAAAAAATAIAPWLSRGWRRAGWVLIVGLACSRFVTAPVSFDTATALASGWLAGSAVLVGLGGPVRRPEGRAVAAGLEGVGVPLARLERADVDARGSTPYFGRTVDGTGVFVKVLGEDERSADLLFRLYRRAMPRDFGDEKPFSTLRRAVEHEALVSFGARSVGVRTPPVLAFATVEPHAFVLAYEAVDGKSLDRVEPSMLTDEIVGALWEQVRVLRTHRIAHRDLRLANLFLGADGQILLIDFGFSELAASDLLLANDLAELTASLSLALGAERAVGHARAAVGPDALASALPRLKPFALSGATRRGLQENKGLLEDVRRLVEVTAREPAAS